MTLASLERDWFAEFGAEDLAAVRNAIPKSINAGHERAARAQTAWEDPDDDQDVYGAAMSKGVQKEFRKVIAELPSFREERVVGTRRTLTYIGDALLFPLRVGKTMPRNHRRIRLSYLPEKRRELFLKTGTRKYDEPGLFDEADLSTTKSALGEQEVGISDVLGSLQMSGGRATLIVPYYSSTPTGVGLTYWAPAKLSGKYLEFADPELLSFTYSPTEVAPTSSAPKPVTSFATGERPMTTTRLRLAPKSPAWNRE